MATERQRHGVQQGRRQTEGKQSKGNGVRGRCIRTGEGMRTTWPPIEPGTQGPSFGPVFQIGSEAQRPDVTCQRPPCWPGEWDHRWPGAGGAGTALPVQTGPRSVPRDSREGAHQGSPQSPHEPRRNQQDRDLHLEAVGDPGNLKALNFKVHSDGGLVVTVKNVLAKPVGVNRQRGCRTLAHGSERRLGVAAGMEVHRDRPRGQPTAAVQAGGCSRRCKSGTEKEKPGILLQTGR